jgi:hypothetical protein
MQQTLVQPASESSTKTVQLDKDTFLGRRPMLNRTQQESCKRQIGEEVMTDKPGAHRRPAGHAKMANGCVIQESCKRDMPTRHMPTRRRAHEHAAMTTRCWHTGATTGVACQRYPFRSRSCHVVDSGTACARALAPARAAARVRCRSERDGIMQRMRKRAPRRKRMRTALAELMSALAKLR